MKKSDRNLLVAAGVAGLGAYFLLKPKTDAAGTVSGIPGVGALLPNSSWVPEKYRGQPSPVWMDAALWGTAGAALGYYGLAGKKLL